MNILNRNFILGFITSTIILTSIFLVFKDKVSSKPISQFAYVDLEKIMKVISQKILYQNLNSEDTERQIDELRVKFDLIVENYSKDNNKLLYSYPRPIKGAQEVTDKLLLNLLADLEGHDQKKGRVQTEESDQSNTYNVEGRRIKDLLMQDQVISENRESVAQIEQKLEIKPNKEIEGK